MNNKGFFISFEGTDGAGKSTVIKRVHEYFLNKGKNVVLTREPGGTNNPLGEEIRELLLNKNIDIDYRAEALLFAASRAQHVRSFIKPNLDKGNIVLCDRYIDSSIVYQGFGRGLGMEAIMKINEFAMDGVLPNLTLILMITPEESMKRMLNDKNREINRLDKEKDLQEKVYNALEQIIKNDKTGRIVRIDASKSKDEVLDEVIKVLEQKI